MESKLEVWRVSGLPVPWRAEEEALDRAFAMRTSDERLRWRPAIVLRQSAIGRAVDQAGLLPAAGDIVGPAIAIALIRSSR